MFKSIYNILQQCDEEKATLLEKGRHLKILKTEAEATKAHPLTLKALNFELDEVREELASIDYIKRTTPVKYAVVSEVAGGEC